MKLNSSFLTLSLTLVFCPVLRSQTNDHNFRSFQWLEDVGAARAAGMGGSFVGLADDPSALLLNPAGLGLLTKTQVTAGMMDRGAGRLPLGDTTASHAGFGFIGGAGPVTKTIAVGAYVTQPQEEEILLTGSVVGHMDSGVLNTSVTDFGGAVSWHPYPTLYLGARLNISHLSLDGGLTHLVEFGRGGTMDVSMASGQSRLAGQAGVLWRTTDDLTLGGSYTQGVRWDVARTAVASTVGPLPTVPFQLSSPSKWSAGFAVRPQKRLRITGEADYILYSRLHETFQVVILPVQTSEYRLRDGLDVRAGAEYTFPGKDLGYEVRGGVWSQAPSAFQFTATSPTTEALSFPGAERRTVATFGASAVMRRGFRLDLGAVLGGTRNVLLAGLTVKL